MQTRQKPEHPFDDDIALTAGGDQEFSAEVAPRWSINDNPDGGYIMAILAGAVLQKSRKPWPAIMTANFISRCVPGPADITVSRLGRSRSFDRWQAAMTQDGRETVRMLATLIDRADDQADKRYEVLPPEITDREKCVRFPQFPGYTLFDQMDVRLDPACAGWLTGDRLSDRSEHKGWIRFREDRDFDLAAILLAIDSFPPPLLASQGMVAWVPTIEMSVNIRNLPRSPWLRGLFRSSFINNGLVEEDALLWDESGELIAISRQIARFRRTA